jgi:hypothetical protein
MKKLFFMLCMIYSIIVFGQFGNDTYIDFAKSPAGFPFIIPNEIKCIADFDGDGYKDIIYCPLGYSSFSKIIFIKNNAGTSFGEPQMIYNFNSMDSRYYNIYQIAAADMNNDGKMDFVVYFNSSEVPTQNGKISWFKNLGNNTFKENPINGISGNGSTMSLLDMDHNGYKDVVIATTASGIGKIYLAKNTNGTFQVSTVPATGQFFRVAAGDMDNDGFIDLVGESDQGIYWFKNNNDTSFTQKQNLNTTINSLKIIVADIDNDGLKDIVYADQASNVLNFYKIKNLGSGTFGSSVVVSQNVVNSDVQYNWLLVDVDEDNLMDISFINSNRNTYLKNLGGFTFANALSKVTIPNSPGLDSLGHFGFYFQDDFTNDNIKEFAIVSFDSLIMCTKTGPAKYATSFSKPVIPAFSSVICSSDVNNDGYTDILAVGKYNGSRILKYAQNASHTFTTPTVIIDSAYDATILQSAKLNNDNLPDVIYYSRRNNAIYYSQNNGSTFATPQVIAASILTDSLFITDVDGDNDLDIIGYHNTEVFSYLNNGNGGFSTKNVVYTSPYSISYLQINDFDKNSKNDIIFSSFNSNKIVWLKNMGYPTFATFEINNTFNKPASFAIGDLDGDGEKDLLVHDYVNYANQSQLYILYNNNFSFTEKVIIDNYNLTSGDLTLLRCSNFRIEDADNDNDNDILLRATGASNDFHYTVFTNDGYGNFTKLYNSTAAHFNLIGKYYFVKEGVITVDIDNDGDKDFISRSGYDDIVLTTSKLKNNGTVKAFAYWDANNNLKYDVGEIILRNQKFILNPAGHEYYTSSNGELYFFDLSGNCSVRYTVPANWSLTTSGLPYSFTMPSDTALNLSYGVKPSATVSLFKPSITAGLARCLDVTSLKVDVNNNGTTVKKIKVEILYDTTLQFISSLITPDTFAKGRIIYIVNNLQPTYFTQFGLKFKMPAFLPGQPNVYPLKANTYSLESGNIYTYNSTDSLSLEIKCAFDPNDKLADPVGVEPNNHYTLNTTTMEYTIRFQNTGNDTARSVYILDTISVWYGSAGYQSPFKIIGSSHPVSSVYIDMFNVLHIEFKGINLPDSSKSYLNSQGFVKFSVAPPVSIPNLTVVKNKAYITFDRNDPILTNEVFNTFVTSVPSVFSAGSDKTICSGQSVTLTATGATSYTWNTGQNTASIVVSPTTTTTYIVTGIVNSVSKKDTVIVNVNPKPTANAGTDKTICKGQTTLLKATGGTTYSWSNGKNTDTSTVSPVITTDYIVTVTNTQGCSAKDTIKVIVNSLVANAGTDKTICYGQTTLLKATGGTTYSWSNGKNTDTTTVSPTTTTDYIVTVTNAQSCTAKDTVKVIVNSLPIANFTKVQNGSLIQFSGPAGMTTYNWNFGDTQSSTSQSPSHTYIGSGLFTVTLTVSNGLCSNSKSDSVRITVTGIKYNQNISLFNVYPNPANDKLNISIDRNVINDMQLSIIDIQGKVLYMEDLQKLKSITKTIDFSKYAKGVYIIQLNENSIFSFKKVIKE